MKRLEQTINTMVDLGERVDELEVLARWGRMSEKEYKDFLQLLFLLPLPRFKTEPGSPKGYINVLLHHTLNILRHASTSLDSLGYRDFATSIDKIAQQLSQRHKSLISPDV